MVSGTKIKHTFAICAYKRSPFLEECIESLESQTVRSEIIMITSTPNEFIEEMAAKHKIPLIINTGQGGIVQDWNFAYKQANTKYVTITHQDDVYLPEYTQTMLNSMEQAKNPIIFFSDYNELREGRVVRNNTLLNVKRIMLLPLRIKPLQKSIFVRRRILSFGSPICCPSVAFHKKRFENPVFKVGFRSCEDWEAWEYLSSFKGEFLYTSKELVYHRIHEGSETSAIINDNARSEEEFLMYRKFWPEWFVKILIQLYSKSQKSNRLEG